MLKRSAGILVYKKENNNIKVLLSHFGGPYWENIDIGGWSIPKGEYNKKEKAIEAAKREFSEETSLIAPTTIEYLTSKKISNKKLAIVFCSNNDFDISKCHSNTFSMEYPKGSGIKNSYPEMDLYEWMDIGKAKEKIIRNQRYFIEKLEQKLIK